MGRVKIVCKTIESLTLHFEPKIIFNVHTTCSCQMLHWPYGPFFTLYIVNMTPHYIFSASSQWLWKCPP